MPPNLSPQSHGQTFLIVIPLLLILLLQHHSQRASSAIILSLKNQHTNQHHRRQPMFQSNQSTCALFAGTWVRDDSYPLYESSDCPLIDAEFNCQMYGRPDKDYLKYRWRPLNCELPRFDGEEFLTKMSGKTVMFVGDSLGRNQWESLICLVSNSARDTQTQMIRGDPLSTFKFLDYGVSLSFYRAPYLVDIGVSHGRRILRLDHISANAADWLSADVISFNSGHWWTHTGSLQGWDYMESGGQYYQDMDRVAAMDKGLRTWANWVDSNIDRSKTRVFFLSISPTHYNPGEWNAGASETERTMTRTTMTSSTKNCYGETSPTRGASAYTAGTYPEQMRVVDAVIRGMHTPISLMDITLLSALRKDGHPSIYSGDLSPQQRANPARSADCSHWCLPGLPDTWNQLFYTALLY